MGWLPRSADVHPVSSWWSACICRGALAFKGVRAHHTWWARTFGPSQALADRGRGSGENIDSTRNASGSALKRNVRSTVRCLAEFCNSHYVSHFAAVFIVARAKTSTVQSYVFVVTCVCVVSSQATRLVFCGLCKLETRRVSTPRRACSTVHVGGCGSRGGEERARGVLLTQRPPGGI